MGLDVGQAFGLRHLYLAVGLVDGCERRAQAGAFLLGHGEDFFEGDDGRRGAHRAIRPARDGCGKQPREQFGIVHGSLVKLCDDEISDWIACGGQKR